MTKMPKVPVSAIDGLLCHRYRNIMFLCIFNSIFSSPNVPLSPGGNNTKFGIQSKEGKLKANLVISLPCASMRNSISSNFSSNINHCLCNDRACH
nr:hypothetical protein Iba_chr14aCG25240 [Ipomoea batatas]